ncbi:MAG: YafY family transcriptional regulator [Acidobacteria bacterium]|nr:YafY family transcriptional regulator [Acidobacteriota bacterium]
MRADRLVAIVLLLQKHHQLTARDLSHRLEVSERTILRDMEALSTAGIPVVAERGQTGGWRLMENYRTTLTGLNQSEVQALFVNPPAKYLSDLGFERSSTSAALKLLAALPLTMQTIAERVQERVFIDESGWNRQEEAIPYLKSLQQAVWQERTLFLTYRRGDETTIERTVHPLGLVVKGSVWYLVAAVPEGEVRSFRVSRVSSVWINDELFERPLDFDLARFWKSSAAAFQQKLSGYVMKARVSKAALPWVRYGGRFAKVEVAAEPDTDGWTVIEVRFDVEEGALQYALGFGAGLEVIEPVTLRERIVGRAKETIELYSVISPNNQEIETNS